LCDVIYGQSLDTYLHSKELATQYSNGPLWFETLLATLTKRQILWGTSQPCFTRLYSPFCSKQKQMLISSVENVDPIGWMIFIILVKALMCLKKCCSNKWLWNLTFILFQHLLDIFSTGFSNQDWKIVKVILNIVGITIAQNSDLWKNISATGTVFRLLWKP